MELSHKLGKLKSALRRVETAAGKGREHCAYCRFERRRPWPDPTKPKPAPGEVINSQCELCHSEYVIDLREYTEEARELPQYIL
jgi:hypothetical protein